MKIIFLQSTQDSLQQTNLREDEIKEIVSFVDFSLIFLEGNNKAMGLISMSGTVDKIVQEIFWKQ